MGSPPGTNPGPRSKTGNMLELENLGTHPSEENVAEERATVGTQGFLDLEENSVMRGVIRETTLTHMF